MPQTFNYVDTSGKTQTTQADSPDLAIKNAPNIAPNSGVSLSSPAVINSGNINSNTQPYNLPTQPTQPTTGNLAQATNSSVANAVTTATLDRPTNPAKEQASNLFSKLIGNQQNQANDINQINQDEQVFQKKQAATALKNDLDQFDKQYSDEIAAIRKNSEGKFGGAVEQDIRRAEERYQNVRANKVLSYNSAIGDYQGASEIAQSKISALKDQNAQELNLYKLAVDAVNNDLTESEKLVAQANIQEKQQKAKTLEDAYATAVQVGLDNGANQNYFNALDTAKESGNTSAIASTISSYGYKSLDQQLQQAQLRKLQSSGVGGSGTGQVSNITQSIIENPSLFDDLTPTIKGQVIQELQANGYDTSNIGVKGLSDTAIKEVSQTQKALADLDGLKLLIQGQENLLGPVSGLQRLNPYSPAKKLQSDVDRVRQTVGKALEGGVLRKEDEEKYKKILATLSDTPSTAIYKIDSLISSIQRDIENYKSLQRSSGKSLDVGASLQKKGQTTTTEDLRSKYRY